MSNEFGKDSLAKLFRPTSDLVNGKVDDVDGLLDPAVRDRLKASNTVIRHGGDTRVLQYHIWDRQQPGIFHKHHFKYEVQYDPFGTKAGTNNTNFCIHFYLNKIRIYHEREAIVARIRRELSAMRLVGFKLKETDRAFSFHHNFHAATAKALLQEIDKYLYSLLNLVHPMFSRVMDAFNVTLTKKELRAAIEGRKKGFDVDRNSPHYGRNAEFKSNVPPPLRLIVLRRDRQICQHCEKRFEISNLHADHVIPVARGGPTTLGNLQTLCGPCNQKKGKRLEAELCFA
jgi:5-methylcytosine-specific restriction endonuclease McrA